MGKRRVHIAHGVPTGKLQEAIDFYNIVFDDITPYIGEVELGTGRKVDGAYWRGPYIYFFLFEGCEIGKCEGLDHFGIQFEDKDEMEERRKRLVKHANLFGPASKEPGRWVQDPVDKMNWELFYKVDDDEF